MPNSAKTLTQLLENSAAAWPQKTALIFGSKKISYQQLLTTSKILACQLYELGLRETNRTALWLPNCPEFVYAYFAILRLGAVCVPVNTMFKREEAKYVIENSGAKVIFCSIDKIEDTENILSRADFLKYIICHPCPKENTIILNYSKLINSSEEFSRQVPIQETDVAEILYTSGTTGQPKGACLTHKNLISNINDCGKIIKLTKKDCVICLLPLFHSFALTVCLLMPLSVGGAVVIMRTVRPFKRVIRAILKHKVTIFPGVPSFFSILGDTHIAKWKLILSRFINPIRICISGAAALPFNVWEKFEKKFGRALLQGYGLTEASPVVSMNPIKGKKAESIGLPLPSVQTKIVNKEDREVNTGEVGELLVKGENIMPGYFNVKKEEQNALRNGWLYTGDLAKKDEEGFLYIMGRIKDMINVRGLNVYPREIEDILYKHPGVKEAAVVGVNHPHRGEAPVAFVTKAQNTLTEKEITTYLRTNLASYKVPFKIIFKDILPKNPTGKILKRQLREEINE